jgi:hypothetical protein
MLAVIGTAGRGSDAAKLSRPLYDAMYRRTLDAMMEWGVRDLVSGGAAWADHLAVRAFLDGEAERLRLFLPARFAHGRFAGPPADAARTANHYHDEFSRIVGIDTLAQIGEAVRNGAVASSHAGFKTRNLEVAAAASRVLAFTFGAGREPAAVVEADEAFGSAFDAGLKDGGTAHTWAQAWRADAKLHVDLGWLAAVPDEPAAVVRVPR